MRIIRWLIILVCIALLCPIFSFSLPKLFPVALPVIQVRAEFPFGDGILSNTLIATILADLVVILFFLSATRNLQAIPRGIQNTAEAFVEAVYSLVKSVAGAKARGLFPLVGTIFFLVLFANWMELVPGVDSVGIVHPAEGTHQGYDVRSLGPVAAVDPKCPVSGEAGGESARAKAEATRAKNGCPPLTNGAEGGVVVPFVRVASTDLNFTMALALVVVFMSQVYGVRALGAGNYFSRFFNLRGFAKSKIFGPMDFVVSILELISEISRIISFTFRLFGNIFAGSVLIFVVSWLIPYIMPVIPYLLEVFVGAIQAFVFMMLATVFISLAQLGHGDEHEEHGEAAPAH